MISIPIEQVDRILKRYDSEIVKIIRRGRHNLRYIIATGCTADEVIYINRLIRNLKKYVLYKPDELEVQAPDLPDYVNPDDRKVFKDKIINALGYSSLRSTFYPSYFNDIGIKSCVYCNSQLTICAEETNSVPVKYSAKFQIDHFLPQKDFPCYCISFYNLYPVCSSCNNSKSSNPISFKLYDYRKNIVNLGFGFNISPLLIAKYISSRKVKNLKIEFTEPSTPLGSKSFNETFDIEGIYNTQADIAEELIIKSLVYTTSYKATLLKSFPSVFQSKSFLDRLIIGNYVETENIHKRPMAKFMQDIAKQVKLIP